MTLTCKLGRPHVFDLKGQRKKVKAVRLNHCQLDYRLYQTSFQFPRTALRAWCHHQHVLLANDINKNIRIIRGRQVSGGSFKWFKKKKRLGKQQDYTNMSALKVKPGMISILASQKQTNLKLICRLSKATRQYYWFYRELGAADHRCVYIYFPIQQHSDCFTKLFQYSAATLGKQANLHSTSFIT